MHHLGYEHGFTTAVGSFQTGGPYSGPHHSMRWQNDHPIWWDALQLRISPNLSAQ